MWLYLKAVESGESALEFLKNNTVDLLILDMRMELEIDVSKPINSHFVSTQIIRWLLQAAIAIGVGQYVKKPYTVQTIVWQLKRNYSVHSPLNYCNSVAL